MKSFEPISLEKQGPYLDRLQKSRICASDYSFINLWGWALEYGLQWSWEDDLVWIRQTRPVDVQWAPVGRWEEIDWKKAVVEAGDDPLEFTRIPEPLLTVWQGHFQHGIRVEEARGHWEYLYEVKELVELRGNRFHNKKNLLNQFQKKYDFSLVPFGADLVEKIRQMQRQWCIWRDCESSETLSAENRVIERVLSSWDRLKGMTGGVILVNGEIAAFTIAEDFCAESLTIHFEKGLGSYTGIYQAINQMFLESVKGFTTVNRQQDLDDDGLRKAKLSYNPKGYIKKYRVSLNAGDLA